MRRQSSPLPFGLRSIVIVVSLTVMAAACSSSSSSPTPTAASVVPTTPAPPSSAPPSGAPGADLSGTWSGHYTGTFNGTFSLTWQQSGPHLHGTIDLGSAGSPSINGTVTGNTIKFGTVGSTAITYSGTVSGDSMSGTYTVGGSAGGSWNANKTS